MANQEHVERLKQKVEAWNAWRKKNVEIQPDLSNAHLMSLYLNGFNLSNANLSSADFWDSHLRGAYLNGANLSRASFGSSDLRDADLRGANLGAADLGGVDLRSADLSGADLGGAHLSRVDLRSANLSLASLNNADLRDADLRGANLSRAHLNNADLSLTNLSGADLSNADLSGVNFRGADLSLANFHNARFGFTIFAWVDLCSVEGLDTAIHRGPSIVNVSTVKLPEGQTRIHFLRGTGFSDTFIDYLPSLLTAAIQYESCFISYAHQDEVLAQRLYKDLQDKGVRCWYAPHDLRPGDYHHSRIDEAIHLHERVLLLLSEHAVASSWVKYEVQIALTREITQDHTILFPLQLDPAIMQAKQSWAVQLRANRHIGNFTEWQDEAIYQQRFAELLRHLKVKTA